MSEHNSRGSSRSGAALSELGDDYRRLLDATQDEFALPEATERDKHDNMLWTRVMSMHHFNISGARANKLTDDLEEA